MKNYRDAQKLITNMLENRALMKVTKAEASSNALKLANSHLDTETEVHTGVYVAIAIGCVVFVLLVSISIHLCRIRQKMAELQIANRTIAVNTSSFNQSRRQSKLDDIF